MFTVNEYIGTLDSEQKNIYYLFLLTSMYSPSNIEEHGCDTLGNTEVRQTTNHNTTNNTKFDKILLSSKI